VGSVTALTGAQLEALRAVKRRLDAGAEQAALWYLRDQWPYVDGRTLTGLVRRGLLERRDPEPPWDEPSYVLTDAGRRWLDAVGIAVDGMIGDA
jgi:hypothetical protein